jgi:hypothetical protein
VSVQPVIYSGATPSYDKQVLPSAEQIHAVESVLSKIVATNEYGQYSGPYPFFDDFPGSQLIEPYKMTSIRAVGEGDIGYRYLWEIEGQDGIIYGNPIKLQINSTGFFSLKVHAYGEDDSYQATFSTTLISK